jgi:hypothetical protein
LGLGPKWAEEYLEHSIDHPEAATANSENPDFAYSKFMKFMRQEGDLPIEITPSSNTENLDSNWTTNFMETGNVIPLNTTTEECKGDDANTLSTDNEQSAQAASWTDEFSKKNSTEQGKLSEF